jgi:ArsR family transcriptional regulator
VVESDGQQCSAVVKARAGEGGWIDAVAGEMERHYSPGRTWESLAHGMLGFATLGDVLDVGSGDGFVASLVAGRARSVTCVDRSDRMIEAARVRLAGRDNVRYAVADMHELPFSDESFDQVALFNVLTFSSDPGRALSEGARVLRCGGTLAVLTLHAHSHEAVTAPYGHVQPGFRAAALRRWLGRAGLGVEQCAVVTRERRAPHFELLSAYATKPAARTARRSVASVPSAKNELGHRS